MNEKDLNNYFNNENPLDDPDIIHKLSVVTTHYAFRNGPVENMHAQGKLSQSTMMKLNKFIVNRLAYIFTLMLDDNEMKVIETYCTVEDIELKLVNATIYYVFIDGIEKNIIDTGKLDENDIKVLVEYMEIKLRVIFRLFLDRNIEMIKNYLALGFFYGQDWDYAIPDSIDFESFLEILKKNSK